MTTIVTDQTIIRRSRKAWRDDDGIGDFIYALWIWRKYRGSYHASAQADSIKFENDKDASIFLLKYSS